MAFIGNRQRVAVVRQRIDWCSLYSLTVQVSDRLDGRANQTYSAHCMKLSQESLQPFIGRSP